MSNPRFQLYEIVRVVSRDPEIAEINGERGAILNWFEGDDGEFGYTVYIYRDEICWDLAESDLYQFAFNRVQTILIFQGFKATSNALLIATWY